MWAQPVVGWWYMWAQPVVGWWYMWAQPVVGWWYMWAQPIVGWWYISTGVLPLAGSCSIHTHAMFTHTCTELFTHLTNI